MKSHWMIVIVVSQSKENQSYFHYQSSLLYQIDLSLYATHVLDYATIRSISIFLYYETNRYFYASYLTEVCI
jgi:hypothetical protein